MNQGTIEDENREWRRTTKNGDYLVSSAVHNLDIDWINNAFDSKDMHWAKSLPRAQISTMLSQSLTLGLYKTSSKTSIERNDGSPSVTETVSSKEAGASREHLQQVGMARFITDYITFAYLTDVYIQDDHRGFDLGKWLVKCCEEIMQTMPALRRGMLLTSAEVGKKFYSRELGFYDVDQERDYMICMTRRAYEPHVE